MFFVGGEYRSHPTFRYAQCGAYNNESSSTMFMMGRHRVEDDENPARVSPIQRISPEGRNTT